MPTPIKVSPGQQRINVFMQPMLRSPAAAESPNTINGEKNHHNKPSHECEGAIIPLTRKRRIDDNDDEEYVITPTPKVRLQPTEIIHVPDTADESDANFSVILMPRRQESPAFLQPVLPTPTPKPVQQRPPRQQSKHSVRTEKTHLISVYFL